MEKLSLHKLMRTLFTQSICIAGNRFGILSRAGAWIRHRLIGKAASFLAAKMAAFIHFVPATALWYGVIARSPIEVILRSSNWKVSGQFPEACWWKMET